ncbi:hypothetical protein [Amycolatopsis rifamycinica]|uniref:Uncharacterized protein n=1 Tax=Amycolatopsis rifamycinica TaxID=287986 RepID=A0A066TS15_9PSEU|nr:hypothetical protein [Amycolatopsis rifamycinica]KDN17976.1 hypothetical protein DV20_33240 [Amycolatopsis rifamycinica]
MSEVFLTPDFTWVVACFGVSRGYAAGRGTAADASPWRQLDEIVHSHDLEVPAGSSRTST